ncbi:hypothetical protein QBC40DRAFT_298324 [Triangularia verruculosa]|uniref:Uncharacterized protein n=1 Tax=Triangularia verruculosa TaxID=2587418 RepID=A0AAN7AV26_9PEZI|nr:hypothetical protein QBC40DRAFT_298324 [Triangularia verruculosa]
MNYASEGGGGIIPKQTDQMLNTIIDPVHADIHWIEEVDGIFRSVLEANPAPVLIAQGLYDEAGRSGRRGQLPDVRSLPKVNIATQDKMQLTVKSRAFLWAKPAFEETVARKLRVAGVRGAGGGMGTLLGQGSTWLYQSPISQTD